MAKRQRDSSLIQYVSSFSDDALLRNICKMDNLIGLCRNCHWEYDTGLVDLA